MRITTAIMAVVSVWATSLPANAQQTYPSKPIKIIVAYAAGQGTDVATRFIAEQVARELGQAVVVENRSGAGGNLGTELVARAPADGYTLTMGTNATHVLNQFLYAKINFDPEKDFEAVGLVGTFPMVLAAGAATPFNSLADMLESGKRSPRSADVAMPSTSARLVLEFLKERSAVPLFGVPYKGSGNAVTDVLGGQLPVLIDTPTALRAQVAAGKLRAIAVTSPVPSSLVPGVKTVSEQGYPGFEFVAWNALFAPKGTPAPVIATLNAAVNKALARPEVRQRLLELGFEPAGGTPAQLTEFARSERKRWAPVIKNAGIKAE